MTFDINLPRKFGAKHLYIFSTKMMQFPIYRWQTSCKESQIIGKYQGISMAQQQHIFLNDNDSPTSHLYTTLQLLKLSQIESGIVLMQYWGWLPLCFLFLLRRRSGHYRNLFSWEKIPPLYEKLMLWSTNQTSFHLKAAFSKIFDGWSSFSYL